MKVCHVSSVHSRHDIRICEKECVSLVKKGYEVYLVVDDMETNEEYKGIHIISTGEKDTGRIKRITNSPKRVLKKALEVDADVYHLHDPELLSISYKLLKSGKKVIFDAHENTERQIETKYYIPSAIRPLISRIFGVYSHRKFRRMTALISVTPSIVNKLKKYNKNVALITNYPIIDDKSYSGKSRNISVDDMIAGEKQDKYVFFAGGIFEQWSHENIIKAVKKVKDVRYLYAGRGREEYLTKLGAQVGGRTPVFGITVT